VRVKLEGSKLRVEINGEVVQDIDLTKFDKTVLRHDKTEAPPLKDRPIKGTHRLPGTEPRRQPRAHPWAKIRKSQKKNEIRSFDLCALLPFCAVSIASGAEKEPAEKRR
jgi:hypothetical protein